MVGSFNFPESVVLGEIYAQALEAAGVPVRREFDLGPRELVLPALRQGLVDVVPEYVGSALQALQPDRVVPPRLPDAVQALAARLASWGVAPLRPSAASNQNGVVVPEASARYLGLTRVSDLRDVAPGLSLGGPPECTRRPSCLPGLEQRYGLRFLSFQGFDTERQRVSALEEGVVDAAVMFTTDGALASGNLVLLRDDRHLQPVENVVPVVSRRAVGRYGERVETALDAVSARLTTRSLVFVNWRVDVDGKPVAAEARGWLKRHGLAGTRR